MYATVSICWQFCNEPFLNTDASSVYLTEKWVPNKWNLSFVLNSMKQNNSDLSGAMISSSVPMSQRWIQYHNTIDQRDEPEFIFIYFTFYVFYNFIILWIICVVNASFSSGFKMKHFYSMRMWAIVSSRAHVNQMDYNSVQWLLT